MATRFSAACTSSYGAPPPSARPSLPAPADAALLRAARRRHPYPLGRGNTRPGRPRRGEVAAFADRLLKYRAEVLCCAGDATVPPDTNGAERDLRVAKLADKASGGFRSTTGAHAFAALRGALSIARKQGRAAGAVLRQAVAPAR